MSRHDQHTVEAAIRAANLMEMDRVTRPARSARLVKPPNAIPTGVAVPGPQLPCRRHTSHFRRHSSTLSRSVRGRKSSRTVFPSSVTSKQKRSETSKVNMPRPGSAGLATATGPRLWSPDTRDGPQPIPNPEESIFFIGGKSRRADVAGEGSSACTNENWSGPHAKT